MPLKSNSENTLNKQLKDNTLASYLPTPPLGQDVTQGHFLSEV